MHITMKDDILQNGSKLDSLEKKVDVLISKLD